MATYKTRVIESLFDQRWNETTLTLSRTTVRLDEIQAEISAYNAAHGTSHSTRNPANFFKDFVRSGNAEQNWPDSVRTRGFTARQVTGSGQAFEFILINEGQLEPVPSIVPPPGPDTPQHRIESASLPLASRRLGRTDEPWLIQVLVRLRVLETHLALFSARNIVQVDHLQMSVKLQKSEIDALFLAMEKTPSGQMDELIVCCEAKGLRDMILRDQVLGQVKAAFAMRGVTQNLVLPMAVKALGPSKVHVVEFDAIARAEAGATTSLRIASEAVYTFVPAVPGIGGQRD